MTKLKNLYLKEGWHLEDSQGKDLGPLSVAFLSDMTKGNVKIGPMTSTEHLRKELDLQRHSELGDHQQILPSNAQEEFVNPREPKHSHVIAYVKDEKATQGLKAVSFAAPDIGRFQQYDVAGFKLGGHGRFMDWFYLPVSRQSEGQDFGKFSVVKNNGHKESLEMLVGRLSLQHVNGNGLLAVHDAPERDLGALQQYGFRALAPKFSIPEVNAKTVANYGTTADEVHIVVKPSANNDSGEHTYGLEFGRAFSLYINHIRESYFPQYASVKGDRVTPLKQKFEASKDMYQEGINRLVDSAVVDGDKVIVPYKDANVTGMHKLDTQQSAKFKEEFWRYALQDFQRYVKVVPGRK